MENNSAIKLFEDNVDSSSKQKCFIFNKTLNIWSGSFKGTYGRKHDYDQTRQPNRHLEEGNFSICTNKTTKKLGFFSSNKGNSFECNYIDFVYFIQ